MHLKKKILTVSSPAPPVDESLAPAPPLPDEVPLDPLLLPRIPDNKLKTLEPAGLPVPPLVLSPGSPPLPYQHIYKILYFCVSISL